MKKWRKDLLLMAGLAVIGAGILAFLLLQEPGTAVQVRVDGEVIGEYPLSVPMRVRIEGVGGYNLLVIKDGSARLEEADCPDQICVRTGSIHQKGQSVVCLPHKVVIEIKSTSDTPAPDVTVR